MYNFRPIFGVVVEVHPVRTSGKIYSGAVEKNFTPPTFHCQLVITHLSSSTITNMSSSDISSYIKYLPEFKVVVCLLCKECVSPNARLRHYEDNHAAKTEYFVEMEVRHRIRDYMATVDLCEPDKVVAPNRFIPELKIIGKGYICKFPQCGACRMSEHSMRTHYYSHKKSVPKDFKDWEETSLQTFFAGRNQK
jgi:hypothetical protein